MSSIKKRKHEDGRASDLIAVAAGKLRTQSTLPPIYGTQKPNQIGPPWNESFQWDTRSPIHQGIVTCDMHPASTREELQVVDNNGGRKRRGWRRRGKGEEEEREREEIERKGNEGNGEGEEEEEKEKEQNI